MDTFDMNLLVAIGVFAIMALAVVAVGMAAIYAAMVDRSVKRFKDRVAAMPVYAPGGMMGRDVRPVNHAMAMCGDCGETYTLDMGHVCEHEDVAAHAARMAYHEMPLHEIEELVRRTNQTVVTEFVVGHEATNFVPSENEQPSKIVLVPPEKRV